AMVEGRLAGLCAARAVGHIALDFEERRAECARQLHELRVGPVGDKIRDGLAKASLPEEAVC
ncbi:MAG: pyridine nucleotide-disulfide oxidoreductase, partial [Clostridia bacterium]|nr:pyridine nucleotide-disulfide oxidoreductase [Clostridia bacterium]